MRPPPWFVAIPTTFAVAALVWMVSQVHPSSAEGSWLLDSEMVAHLSREDSLRLGVQLGNAIRAPQQGTCTTSGTAWPYGIFPAQRDSFSVEYDDTPLAASLDAHTALAPRIPTAYAGLAVIVRFNSVNLIDVRNGGAYAALRSVAYTPGTTYHLRLRVSIPGHRYSVWVTPPGGAEQQLAQDYRFRLEQDTVVALNYWTAYSTANTKLHTVCNLQVQPLFVAAGVAYSPQPLDFGSVLLGASSPVLTSTLTNLGGEVVGFCGADPLPVGCQAHSSMTGSPAFHYVTDNCTSVAPGASCVLRYQFTPLAAGTVTGANVVQTTAGPFPLTFVGVGEDTTGAPPPPPVDTTAALMMVGEIVVVNLPHLRPVILPMSFPLYTGRYLAAFVDPVTRDTVGWFLGTATVQKPSVRIGP